MVGESYNSDRNNSIPESSEPNKKLIEIAKKHNLNEKDTDIFMVNVSMVSQGIVEYFSASDPEDGLETMEMWVDSIDMHTTMAPNIVPALIEALKPFSDAFEEKKQNKKRK